LTNPGVMQQIMNAIAKALEVEDKQEAEIISESIKNAFNKITSLGDNKTLN